MSETTYTYCEYIPIISILLSYHFDHYVHRVYLRDSSLLLLLFKTMEAAIEKGHNVCLQMLLDVFNDTTASVQLQRYRAFQ